MPPRHTYWTILFGDKPTAFRSATQEELLPTFKQIQAKHPDAVMMWFARGKLWRSEEESRAAFDRPRFDRPRGSLPESQGRTSKPAWRDKPQGDRPRGPRPEWQNRGSKPDWSGPPPGSPKPFGGGGNPRRDEGGRPAWKDKPHDDRPRGPRPEWRDKPHANRPGGPRPGWKNSAGKDKRFDRPPSAEGGRPAWQNRGPKPEWRDKPKPDARGPRPEWKDKPQGDRPPGPKPAWRDKPRFDRPPSGEGGRPPWLGPPKPRSGEGGKDKPHGDRPRGPSPEWQNRGPKPERPKGDGPPDRRGSDWRPGGAHKDPRDRFKVPRDVKRARFKDKLRRDRTHPKPRSGEGGPPRKKKDEE